MTMFGMETKELVLQRCLSAIVDFQKKYKGEWVRLINDKCGWVWLINGKDEWVWLINDKCGWVWLINED